MAELWMNLPAYASDYSGACAVCAPLRTLCVIHGATGCANNYVTFDDPDAFEGGRVLSSGLRELDAVMGGDDLLIEETETEIRRLRPPLVLLAGTPVPMLIGTDLEGIAAELESRTGVPCIGVAATGTVPYNRGAAKAFLRLAERFAAAPQSRTRRANVLGLTALDFPESGTAAVLNSFLREAGFEPPAQTFEDLKELGHAAVTLVVSQSGLDAAQYLKDRFGVPWVCGLPGPDTEKLLHEAAETGQCAAQDSPSNGGGLLIVGEQVQANALREAFRRRCPGMPVAVGTLLGLDMRIAAPGDLNIRGEAGLAELLASGQYTSFVGDPLMKSLIPRGSAVTFMPVPHYALSSRLFKAGTLPWKIENISVCSKAE
jgi:nitrogenase molybdenum-cofactor synthesis protein NifE